MQLVAVAGAWRLLHRRVLSFGERVLEGAEHLRRCLPAPPALLGDEAPDLDDEEEMREDYKRERNACTASEGCEVHGAAGAGFGSGNDGTLHLLWEYVGNGALEERRIRTGVSSAPFLNRVRYRILHFW